jgi:hypothetical protein
MLHNGADHTTIAMPDQPARKPLSRSVNRVTARGLQASANGGHVDTSRHRSPRPLPPMGSTVTRARPRGHTAPPIAGLTDAAVATAPLPPAVFPRRPKSRTELGVGQGADSSGDPARRRGLPGVKGWKQRCQSLEKQEIARFSSSSRTAALSMLTTTSSYAARPASARVGSLARSATRPAATTVPSSINAFQNCSPTSRSLAATAATPASCARSAACNC